MKHLDIYCTKMLIVTFNCVVINLIETNYQKVYVSKLFPSPIQSMTVKIASSSIGAKTPCHISL